MEPQTQKSSHGALIGSIVIVIILVIGGIYLFKSAKMDYEARQKAASQLYEDEVANSLSNQNSSDEVSDIESDLNSTNLDNLTPEKASNQ